MSDEVDDFLAHFGVKGMKWGVRKDRDGGSSKRGSASNDKTDAYGSAMAEFYAGKSSKELAKEGGAKLKAQSNQTFPGKKYGELRSNKADRLDKEAARVDRLIENRKAKLEAGGKGARTAYGRANLKAEIKELEKSSKALKKASEQVKDGKFTTNEKILIGVGAAVAVGLTAHYGHKLYKESAFRKINAGKVEANKRRTSDEWSQLFGEQPTFKKATGSNPSDSVFSGATGFYQGLRSGKALDRPEFTIPKTMTFQRLSNAAETGEGYGGGAYSTFLSNDKALYGSSLEFGKKKFTVSFNPSEDVRVPSTRTVLETLRESQYGLTGKKISEKEALTLYHGMSGGDWKTDPKSASLIDALKKKGYSALVDDMDAGYMGDLPVVFFGEPSNVSAKPRKQTDFDKDHSQILPTINKYA